MKISSPLFEDRTFFRSRSVLMLEDFPQLANRVWARNCACVLLLLCCQSAFVWTPFINYKFAQLSKEIVLSFQSTVLS